MRNSSRVQLVPAFLLHQRAWRDSSRIIEFLARDHGRVVLFAKGVRRAGSSLGAVLQPFAPLVLSWVGSGDGGTLTGAEFDGEPLRLPPARLMSGYYLNELLLRLLGREDPHPQVYCAYREALAGLGRDASQSRVLRLFEKRLLDALGLGVDYAHLLADGAPVRADAYYHVAPARGVLGLAARADAASACHGAELLSLAAEQLEDPASLATARRLLSAALAGPLDGHELASRRVARAVRAGRAAKGEPSQ
jgi:DNA repair protein RecO (recombination protein O)